MASDKDVIKIPAGVYNEAVRISSGISLTLEGEVGAIITGGIIATATANGGSGKTLTISGLEFRTAGLEVDGYDDVKILNNKFIDITSWTEEQLEDKSGDAIYVHGSNGKVLIQGNTINGVKCDKTNVGDGMGITVLDLDEITITGNTISDTWHNSINIFRGVEGTVTITGNTFENWDSNKDYLKSGEYYMSNGSDEIKLSEGCEGGRALRLDLAGAVLIITGNNFYPNNYTDRVDLEYVKITGIVSNEVSSQSIGDNNNWPEGTVFENVILVDVKEINTLP